MGLLALCNRLHFFGILFYNKLLYITIPFNVYFYIILSVIVVSNKTRQKRNIVKEISDIIT